MIPSGITKKDILEALRDLDAGKNPPNRGSSKKYDLLRGGRRYAPKSVIAFAARRLNNGKPLVYGYSGGSQTNDVLIGGLAFNPRVVPGAEAPGWRYVAPVGGSRAQQRQITP